MQLVAYGAQDIYSGNKCHGINIQFRKYVNFKISNTTKITNFSDFLNNFAHKLSKTSKTIK